jgi:hypothetical protein
MVFPMTELSAGEGVCAEEATGARLTALRSLPLQATGTAATTIATSSAQPRARAVTYRLKSVSYRVAAHSQTMEKGLRIQNNMTPT